MLTGETYRFSCKNETWTPAVVCVSTITWKVWWCKNKMVLMENSANPRLFIPVMPFALQDQDWFFPGILGKCKLTHPPWPPDPPFSKLFTGKAFTTNNSPFSLYVPVPTVIIKMETTFRMPFSFTGGGIYMRKIKKRISGISGVHRPAVLTAGFQPSVFCGYHRRSSQRKNGRERRTSR